MEGSVYFPIARAKAGEIEALGRLSPRAHARTRPMLDFAKQTSKDWRPPAQYLAEKISEITESWGTEREVLLDFSRYEPDATVYDGRHIVEYVFDVARQRRLKAVPVAAPLAVRGPGLDYFAAVSRVAQRDGRGIALRVPYEEFSRRKALEKSLREVATVLEIPLSQTDVYLDANSLALVPEIDRDEVELTEIVRNAATAVQGMGARRVVFAASALPDSLARHKKGETLTVVRTELRVWRRVVADPAFRFLRFGDYGVIYPSQIETDAQVIPPSRVRLSLDDTYVLYKGARDDIRALTQSVLADGHLGGIQDSWGCNAIRECARGYGDPGGPSQWIARDFNMHIEATVEAIARLVPPESGGGDASSTSRRSPWLQESFDTLDDV